MSNLNQQFIYSIFFIALGYLLKRVGIIKERDGEGLSRIVFNITLPALIIVTFNNIKIDSSLILLLFTSMFYGFLMAGIGIFTFRKEKKNLKGMLAMMVPGLNIGLFAYPLVEGIWGHKGLLYFGMFDTGNSLIVFGVIYLIASYYASDDTNMSVKSIFSRIVRSIPFMTYIVVFLLNIIGWHLPHLIINVANIASGGNMPLSLLLLGIYLNFRFEKGYNRLIIRFLLVRYGVALILGILLFILLPFDKMFKYTVLIGFILPVSLSTVPYSVEFKYNSKFVGTVSNITILISFFLLWGIANIFI